MRQTWNRLITMTTICFTGTSIAATQPKMPASWASAIHPSVHANSMSQNVISEKDQITRSDKYKAIGLDYMKNQDYANAKVYFHKAISTLKNRHKKCIDATRAIELKMLCDEAQEFINHSNWGFTFKTVQMKEPNINAILVDQLHAHKVPGYENITTDELETVISEAEDNAKMLEESTAMAIFTRFFDDDGFDYVIEDPTGVYHLATMSVLMEYATAANVLNVNLAILSHDTEEPIIIKQKNAIATLYIGFDLILNRENDLLRSTSAYRDASKPSKSIDELVATTAYSYEE